MKKTTKIFLVSLLCLSAFFAACGSGEDESHAAETDGLTVLTAFHTSPGYVASHWGNDMVSQTIIERTGVTLEWEVNAMHDDDTRLNLMISSRDLPDLLFIGRNGLGARTLIDAGLVYSWDELFYRYSPQTLTSPFITRNRPFLAHEGTNTIYTVPFSFADRNAIDDGTIIMQAPGYYVNTAILNAIGNPRLETLEDLEYVLRRAMEYDPSIANPLFLWNPVGNGWDANGIDILYRSMGGRGDFFVTPEGLRHVVRDPLYKETLMFVNRLFNQGFIAHNNFMDGTMEQEAINNEGSFVVSAGSLWRAIAPNEIIPTGIDPIPHLEQPGVSFTSPVTGLNGTDGFFVTSSNPHLEATARFLAYIISDEGHALRYVGIEGEHFEWGGPDNNWIVLIGESRDIMEQEGFGGWMDAFGTYRHQFAGYRSIDSAFSWGLGADDPWRVHLNTLNNIGIDASDFEDLHPNPESLEGANLSTINDLQNHFVANIAMASSQAEAEALYNEMLATLEAQGLAAIEAIWTENFNR